MGDELASFLESDLNQDLIFLLNIAPLTGRDLGFLLFVIASNEFGSRSCVLSQYPVYLGS